MARNRPGGLGKGLDALFADNSSENNTMLPISEIEPNQDQPRKSFSQESLAELADSIRDHGILQPLLVRPMPAGRYQLIAGERRWRAARMAGENSVPVIIREMSDQEAMELALIENLQREDLNPVEEAMGYRQLIEQYDMTQEKVAQVVGKSRPAVANALRLEEPQIIRENAAKVLADKITVRDIEQMARKIKKAEKRSPSGAGEKTPHSVYQELELALAEELGRRVIVRPAGREGGGSLVIDFFDTKDLCDLASRLTGQPCSF